MAKGLELAGVNHLAFVEWNEDACKTLRENFDPKKVFEGDVRVFRFEDYDGVDIIAGGPPCQPFSLGGKARGNEDNRDMFPSAIAAIRTLRPKAFVFENVKGLLRKSFAEYFKYILLQLKYPDILLESDSWKENLDKLLCESGKGGRESSYDVTYHLVNAADYGVPQMRERVIIVGFRRDLGAKWDFPCPTHSGDALSWSKFVTGEYWTKHNVDNPWSSDTARKKESALLGKYGMFPPVKKPWLTVRDALAGLGEPGNCGDHILRGGAKEYPGHTGSSIDEPSKTIKAGAHGVPGGENMLRYTDGHLRYFSVAEAKRIQTFPDDYKVTGAWSEAMRQLGNAVPVRLAETIARAVINTLENCPCK